MVDVNKKDLAVFRQQKHHFLTYSIDATFFDHKILRSMRSDRKDALRKIWYRERGILKSIGVTGLGQVEFGSQEIG